MPSHFLLDTCAAIWISSDVGISDEAETLLNGAARRREPLFISPITAWEVGLLAARGRMNLAMPPAKWFQRLFEAPQLALAQMPPEVLIASSFLPGTPPADPADRIIAATAREFGYRLVTRDRELLAYGEQGHVHVVRC